MPHKKPAVSTTPTSPAVRALRTGDAYARMIAAPAEKRADLYRHELMAPFKAKWDCYHVPLRPAQPGGYDAVMASEMLGILPPERVDQSWADAVRRLADEELWRASRQAVEHALARFVERGIELRVQDYLFSVLLGDPDSPALAASDGYCGDGGIPGYSWRGSCRTTIPCAGCPPRSRTRRTTTCASSSSPGTTTSRSAR